MTETDKRIYDTLFDISKGCSRLLIVYGTCDGCPFKTDDSCCVLELLGNELAKEPRFWDLERIKELIEL